MPKMVVCQKWEEAERGMGSRPDGYSLHVSEEHRARFVKAYWDKQPDGPAPDEYTRQSGAPYECPVTDALYARVELAGDGVWSWTLKKEERISSATDSPWPGGTSGWCGKNPPRLDVEKN